MDCAKVGRLILQLRTEKGLTQRQLADELHISNKTVSKWECGMGCPDVSLWDALSRILGADIPHLLQGELKRNRPDPGKLGRIQFYVCPVCGNLLTSTGAAAVACCGRQLPPLEPAAAGAELHRPTVEPVEDEYYVTIRHEMRREHYLLFAAFVKDDRLLLHRLYPEQEPAFRVPYLRGGSFYLYCTRHGLMRYPFDALTGGK